jgi:hypothetical protein
MTVRAALRRIYNIGRTLTLVPMAAEPVATHLPVLVALARIRKIRRVLEFGSGRYSTLAFLDRTAFPDLEALQSYENNAEWHAKITTMAGGDSRLNLIYVNSPVHEVVHLEPLRTYDLIFIDDSRSVRQRSATIRAVTAGKPPLAVVHDFQTFAYRRAVHGFNQVFRFNALLPNTGIAWNDDSLTVEQLRVVKTLINQNRQLPPQDLHRWANYINIALRKQTAEAE